MENSLYAGLSRQVVLQRSMDLVANNVANVNTPGYRGQNPLFKEYIADPRGIEDPLSLVYDFGQYDTTAPGPMQVTGGTYDVALEGPGFMGVQTPSGEIQYTRAGNFTVNQSSQLVTPAGYAVAGNGGAPIVVPPGTQEVVIASTGDVIADGNSVGRISVVEFENLQDLKPQGNGLYSATAAGVPATETNVRQGMLEGSNVNSVQEMTRMIEILRTYQSTQRMISNEHERQLSAIQKLSQTNG
jgi:flagellar basal-body rod protein FlgF